MAEEYGKGKTPLPLLSAKITGQSISKMTGTLDKRLGTTNTLLNDIKGSLIAQRNMMVKQMEANKEAFARQAAANALKDDATSKDAKKAKEGTTIRGGVSRGVESGLGSILGGIGAGLGVLSTFVGIGGGIAALGVGIGGFFTGISAADAAIGALGTGENFKTLLTNVGDGISSLDATAMAGLGVLLGTSALFGAATGPAKQFKAATGMTMIGLGIGGFMAGLAAAGDLTGFTGDVFASQAANLTKGIKEFASLDQASITALGLIAASGALVGAIAGPTIAGKAAVGMGLAGLGIGGFMAGIAAAGDITGFKGDIFATQARNVADGMKAFSGIDDTTKAGLVIMAGLGAITGAANPSLGAFAAVGMGLAGFGIGAFMTGIAAAGDITGFKGDVFAAQAKNIADGLSAFSGAQLAGLSALMVTGGVLGATGLGNVAAGGAALGMGLIGLGIGAFISGIAGAGEVASWMGADGSGIKTMLTNIGGGLSEFEKVDGTNLKNVGDGMMGLGAGLLAFMGAQGLGGITDTVRGLFESAWNWITGNDEETQQKGRFDAIIEELQAFNGADFSGITALSNLNIGAALSDLATGLGPYDELDDLNTREVTNFINGPMTQMKEVADDSFAIKSIRFSMGVERIADALTKFASVNFRQLQRFDFEDFVHDLAIGADGIDVAMNGGTFRWGTNVTVDKGLATNAEEIHAGSAAITALRRALGHMEETMPQTQALDAASAATVGPAGGTVNIDARTSNVVAPTSSTNSSNMSIGQQRRDARHGVSRPDR